MLFRSADRKKKAQPAKRKASTDDSAPTAKRARSSISKQAKSPAAKKIAKPKTPAKKKSTGEDFEPSSSTVMTASERRRSGRGASAKKVYVDRDDSEDDEEMLEGVSKWEYEDGRVESDHAPSASASAPNSELASDEEEEEDEDIQSASSKKASQTLDVEMSEVGEDLDESPKETSPVAEKESSTPLSNAEARPKPEAVEREEEEREVTPKPKGKENKKPEAKVKPKTKAKPVVRAKSPIKKARVISHPKARAVSQPKALPTRGSARNRAAKAAATKSDDFDIPEDE